MVITINEKNQQLYNDFFVEAYKDAKSKGIVDGTKTAFESLWEYYHYLPELAAQLPVYYTKLPLDEPMMVIDGNSRKIDVPAQLTKCASVQNDHLAESIMFSIDRYHDGQDLTNATIWIQWTANNNGEKVEGVTAVPADYRDINFEQNKIRFPWILDESVTQYPGDIEFAAVFFFMREGSNDIAYRYSTLPAKIRIEPSLQKDLADNAIDVGGMFAASVRTNTYGPGFYAPVIPYFISGQGGIDLLESSDLKYIDENDLIGSLVLEAQATVTDTGTINYAWKHILPDSTIEFECGADKTIILKAGTAITDKEKEFIEIYKTNTSGVLELEDNKVKQDTTIRYSFGQVEEIYVPSQEINKFDRYYADAAGEDELTFDQAKTAFNNGENVYERITRFTLPNKKSEQPVTGKYFVVAINSIRANNASKESEPKISTKTTLISPKSVVINEQNTIESVTFKDGKAVLNTKLETNFGETYVIDMEKSIFGVDENTITNKLTLKSAEDVSGITLDEKNNVDLSSINGAGWYQATITAKRNRETKEDVTKIWRVLNPVTAPQITDAIDRPVRQDDKNGTIVDSNEPKVTLSVEIDNQTLSDYFGAIDTEGKINLISDGYYCQWSILEPDKGSEVVAVETTGNYTVDNLSSQGMVCYQCELFNTLNNETASSSCRFYVM